MRAAADNRRAVIGTMCAGAINRLRGRAACVGARERSSHQLPFTHERARGAVTSFNIVIIGGMGSLPGPQGGILVRRRVEPVLSPAMTELVSFCLLIAILLFRPAGLFGKAAG
jgi:hypothetical protein